MIAETLQAKIGEALKAKDEIRLSTLRLLSSAFNYEFIAKQHKLSEEEEIAVIQREIKKRRDAIEAYEKGGANDRAEKEKKEMEILQEFLPEQLSDEELSKIVDEAVAETGAKSLPDMGKVMGQVMTKVSGKADGGRVSALVKARLQG